MAGPRWLGKRLGEIGLVELQILGPPLPRPLLVVAVVKVQ
jgi:hypothetical protein